jgi:hypothetical protein
VVRARYLPTWSNERKKEAAWGLVHSCWLTDWLTAKLLLALASTVVLGSESHGINGPILLSSRICEPSDYSSHIRVGDIQLIYIKPVRTSQKTHSISVTTTNRLTPFRETVAVYCKNQMEHTNTPCGMLNHMVDIVTRGTRADADGRGCLMMQEYWPGRETQWPSDLGITFASLSEPLSSSAHVRMVYCHLTPSLSAAACYCLFNRHFANSGTNRDSPVLLNVFVLSVLIYLKATCCKTEEPGLNSRQGKGICLSFTVSRPSLGTTQPPTHWAPGALSPG